MFWACFTYDYKGPCHIYYPETEEQKIKYLRMVQHLNEEEIEEECRLAFENQEQQKERIWTENRKRWPTRCVSWEVY